MNIFIRPAAAPDLEQMFYISSRAHQSGYNSFIPDSHVDTFAARYEPSDGNKTEYVERVRAYCADKKWHMWVALVDQRIVGFTHAYRDSGEMVHLKALFVDPKYQGSGIGAKLFDASLTIIDRGVIYLTVIALNQKARTLYESRGFSVWRDTIPFYGAKQIEMIKYKY